MTEQFAKYVVILFNEDIFDVPPTKLIGMLVHQILESVDMNSKSKSDESSLTVTLDESNFSTRKLIPRKYFVASI